MNMIRYVPIITAFLKRPLMLAALVCLLSCGGRQEATPPADHARQADSLVAACKGLDALQELLARFEAVHDDRGRMRALTEIGKIHRESSDFSTAVNLHEEALTLAREQKDTANIIYILNQLGTDFRRLGMLDEAAVRHYEALSHCEAFSDRSSARALKSRAVSLNGIGNLQLTLQNNDVAESIFRQALAVEQSLKSHLGQAINYANIGYIKEARGERDSAWIYYGYSMEQNRLADSRLGVSLCYNHFGRLAEQMGDYRKALESYLSAYDLMADDKDRWHWLESCLSIAKVYLAMGQSGQARPYLDEGLKTATEIKSWEHLAEAYRLKALFDEANGHYQAALDNHRKYKAYTDSLTNEKKINRLNNLRLKYITEKGNKEKEIISQAYNDEQQQKQVILYSLITVILVSAAAISLLIYALRVKAKMQNVIKKASRARQEFFTNVTHEFRTPLTVILGSAQELKAKARTPSVELDAISRQGQRLLTLVNQLLDIAKVRSAIGKADWKTGNIVVFIQMVVENVSLQATRNRVEVGYRPEEKEVNMDFVPDFMYKILTNLLYNALKFTPQGGRISIRSRVVGKSIRISVEDTGCGIKPDDLPRIFEPFFQSDSHKDAGTGIGLALTKQMTEAMGGRIEVSSRQGEGTLFSLSIPIRNSGDRLEKWVPEAKVAEHEVADSEAPKETVNQDDAITKDADIALVVEDNEDIARYIGNIIKDSFSVVYARNGREGLLKAKEYVPDIIITDIMMPECDGLEMTRAIRQSTLLNHIPVIIVTAKSDETNKLEGLNCGADAYLIKPFNPDELKLRICKLVAYRSMLRGKYSQLLMDGRDISKEPDAPEQEKNFLAELNRCISSHISLSNLNSEMIAKTMCLSKSQLNRKVKSLTGMNTSSYIKQLRLARAQMFLKDPKKTIGDIVMMCGFESASYFTKMFKEKFGITPSEYKRNNTEDDSETDAPETRE